MSTPAPTPVDPKELRPLLHAEIDRLPDENLELAHRMLLEIELQQLDGAADEARTAGRLTPESIAAAVAEHRAKHPYQG